MTHEHRVPQIAPPRMNGSTQLTRRVRACRRGLIALSWSLVSCGRAPGGEAIAPHGKPGSAVPRAKAAPPANAEVERSTLASNIRVDAAPLPALAPEVPLVEIARPSFGELLDGVASRSQEVRVRLELPGSTAAGFSVWVALDGQRPRVLPATGKLLLGELMPEDQELRGGQHVLFAIAVDAQGRVLRVPEGSPRRGFALVEFFIGERTGELSPPSAPRLFCLSPSGTLYGGPSEPVLLELFALGPATQEGSVPLLVEAGGESFATRVDASRSHRILGLPRGDVRLTAGAAPGLRAECIVTLNPEASPSKVP